eukprot:Clim_evm6s3 gene=Clim_evmTU6s3
MPVPLGIVTNRRLDPLDDPDFFVPGDGWNADSQYKVDSSLEPTGESWVDDCDDDKGHDYEEEEQLVEECESGILGTTLESIEPDNTKEKTAADMQQKLKMARGRVANQGVPLANISDTWMEADHLAKLPREGYQSLESASPAALLLHMLRSLRMKEAGGSKERPAALGPILHNEMAQKGSSDFDSYQQRSCHFRLSHATHTLAMASLIQHHNELQHSREYTMSQDGNGFDVIESVSMQLICLGHTAHGTAVSELGNRLRQQSSACSTVRSHNIDHVLRLLASLTDLSCFVQDTVRKNKTHAVQDQLPRLGSLALRVLRDNNFPETAVPRSTRDLVRHRKAPLKSLDASGNIVESWKKRQSREDTQRIMLEGQAMLPKALVPPVKSMAIYASLRAEDEQRATDGTTAERTENTVKPTGTGDAQATLDEDEDWIASPQRHEQRYGYHNDLTPLLSETGAEIQNAFLENHVPVRDELVCLRSLTGLPTRSQSGLFDMRQVACELLRAMLGMKSGVVDVKRMYDCAVLDGKVNQGDMIHHFPHHRLWCLHAQANSNVRFSRASLTASQIYLTDVTKGAGALSKLRLLILETAQRIHRSSVASHFCHMENSVVEPTDKYVGKRYIYTHILQPVVLTLCHALKSGYLDPLEISLGRVLRSMIVTDSGSGATGQANPPPSAAAVLQVVSRVSETAIGVTDFASVVIERFERATDHLSACTVRDLACVLADMQQITAWCEDRPGWAIVKQAFVTAMRLYLRHLHAWLGGDATSIISHVPDTAMKMTIDELGDFHSTVMGAIEMASEGALMPDKDREDSGHGEQRPKTETGVENSLNTKNFLKVCSKELAEASAILREANIDHYFLQVFQSSQAQSSAAANGIKYDNADQSIFTVKETAIPSLSLTLCMTYGQVKKQKAQLDFQRALITRSRRNTLRALFDSRALAEQSLVLLITEHIAAFRAEEARQIQRREEVETEYHTMRRQQLRVLKEQAEEAAQRRRDERKAVLREDAERATWSQRLQTLKAGAISAGKETSATALLFNMPTTEEVEAELQTATAELQKEYDIMMRSVRLRQQRAEWRMERTKVDAEHRELLRALQTEAYWRELYAREPEMEPIGSVPLTLPLTSLVQADEHADKKFTVERREVTDEAGEGSKHDHNDETNKDMNSQVNTGEVASKNFDTVASLLPTIDKETNAAPREVVIEPVTRVLSARPTSNTTVRIFPERSNGAKGETAADSRGPSTAVQAAVGSSGLIAAAVEDVQTPFAPPRSGTEREVEGTNEAVSADEADSKLPVLPDPEAGYAACFMRQDDEDTMQRNKQSSTGTEPHAAAPATDLTAMPLAVAVRRGIIEPIALCRDEALRAVYDLLVWDQQLQRHLAMVRATVLLQDPKYAQQLLIDGLLDHLVSRQEPFVQNLPVDGTETAAMPTIGLFARTRATREAFHAMSLLLDPARLRALSDAAADACRSSTLGLDLMRDVVKQSTDGVESQVKEANHGSTERMGLEVSNSGHSHSAAMDSGEWDAKSKLTTLINHSTPMDYHDIVLQFDAPGSRSNSDTERSLSISSFAEQSYHPAFRAILHCRLRPTTLPPWPQQALVLDSGAMRAYSDCGSFVTAVRSGQWSVTQACREAGRAEAMLRKWQRQRAGSDLTVDLSVFRLLHLLRGKLSNFAVSLLDYVTVDVLAVAERELDLSCFNTVTSSGEKAKTLQRVMRRGHLGLRAQHEAYLRSLQDGLFMPTTMSNEGTDKDGAREATRQETVGNQGRVHDLLCRLLDSCFHLHDLTRAIGRKVENFIYPSPDGDDEDNGSLEFLDFVSEHRTARFLQAQVAHAVGELLPLLPHAETDLAPEYYRSGLALRLEYNGFYTGQSLRGPETLAVTMDQQQKEQKSSSSDQSNLYTQHR